MGSAAATRMAKEIRMLQSEPPPGVWAAPKGDRLTELEAQIQGPKDTVYEGGVFSLSVHIPARYPFEPPKVKFETPIYHPNIDPEGRICLDILNMPPKGGWKPSLSVPTVLASIGLLLAEPNPDDGLVTDITAEFRHQRQVFDAKARQWTQRHAVQHGSGSGDGSGAPGGAACQADAPAAAPQQQQQQAEQGGGSHSGGKENGPPALVGAAGGKGEAQVAAGPADGHAETAAPPAAEAQQQQQQQQQPTKRPRLALRK